MFDYCSAEKRLLPRYKSVSVLCIFSRGLCDYGLDEVAVDVGEAAVDAVVAEGEFFVVDAQEVEDGGVDVVAVGGFYGFVGPFVAFAGSDAALDAAAR